jgi:hypothetical protein
MSTPIEKALAYVDALEADRRAALALSEQKAEEARLLKARQEGFQAAMEMLGTAIPVPAISGGDAASDPGEPRPGEPRPGEPRLGEPRPTEARPTEPRPNEPRRRRVRRDIRQLILRELSFSGEAMTATQIAKAVDYQFERTEIALHRMEETGQVVRDAGGRWAIGNTAMAPLNGHAATGDNGKSPLMPEAVGGSI